MDSIFCRSGGERLKLRVLYLPRCLVLYVSHGLLRALKDALIRRQPTPAGSVGEGKMPHCGIDPGINVGDLRGGQRPTGCGIDCAYALWCHCHVLALKIALAAIGMTLIVPLAIWGMTGSLKHALFAWKRYMLIMGLLIVPAALFSALLIVLP